MEKEFNEASKESRKAFGEAIIFVEKYLRSPKHIEVQILGDNYGNIVHLYDRDFSVQRRNQKVVEYAPAFSINVRERIFDCSKRLASYVKYRTLPFEVNGFYRQVRILDKHYAVKDGDTVKENQPLLSLEAMKMETTVLSTVNGEVDTIYVKAGDTVSSEDLLITFK